MRKRQCTTSLHRAPAGLSGQIFRVLFGDVEGCRGIAPAKEPFERVVDRHLPELVRRRNVNGLRRVLKQSPSLLWRQGSFKARRIFLDHSHAPQHIKQQDQEAPGQRSAQRKSSPSTGPGVKPSHPGRSSPRSYCFWSSRARPSLSRFR